MDTYAQLEMLTAVIANLSATGTWTEREVMETLLDVFPSVVTEQDGTQYIEEYYGG
jgi:hypothetical protein